MAVIMLVTMCWSFFTLLPMQPEPGTATDSVSQNRCPSRSIQDRRSFTTLTFLGIELDSQHMIIRLPREKHEHTQLLYSDSMARQESSNKTRNAFPDWRPGPRLQSGKALVSYLLYNTTMGFSSNHCCGLSICMGSVVYVSGTQSQFNNEELGPGKHWWKVLDHDNRN